MPPETHWGIFNSGRIKLHIDCYDEDVPDDPPDVPGLP